MNHKCQFDPSIMSFMGAPLEQARCLLRFVQRLGNVGDAPADIPATLTGLLGTPDTLGFTKEALRSALAARSVSEEDIGGSLDEPVSRANNNDEGASPANYFVIHDTSNKLAAGQTFDPAFINSAAAPFNHLENQPSGATHVYISRDGKTRTDLNYKIPERATQFELQHVGSPDNPRIHKGRFLHHELVQPRKGPGQSDADAPAPGFTDVQYELLALCYLAASLRRGRWLIPAFHCVLDLQVGDHDDPQHFDLLGWDAALGTLLAEVQSAAGTPHDELASPILTGDLTLERVVRGELTLTETGGQVAGIGPVQDALNTLSVINPALGIALGGNRGAFGPRTEAAVRAFQADQGLPTTGDVDADTLHALDDALVALTDERHGADGEEFTTPPASSETTDGSGGSTTTGLNGRITFPSPGVERISASETLTAKRSNHSLGAPKVVTQVRVTEDGVTQVSQADYCWGERTLPDAELTEAADDLADNSGAFEGKATFFGKGDTEDEGTGAPTFGTVQTNSSVFGISLPSARLVSEGLATRRSNGVLVATEKGISTRVEVFFRQTGRRALLPVVDIGPGANTGAAADLTVAASAFLQKLTEDDIRDLDNIHVTMRVV